jgi:hypothetical protein
MWAGKDNHKNVRWSQAKKYCRNLRLAGYQDWRLPTIEELYGIYDRSVSSPGLAGKHDDEPFAYHVRGGLFLTGDEWSSTERLDNNGHPIGFAAYFDFTNGPSQFHWEDSSFLGSGYNRHALCVRGPVEMILP